MKFSEVVDSLMEYKHISRSSWADGKFLYLDKEQNWFAYHIKEDYEEDDYECITYRLNLSPEDIFANDWEILDEIL